MSPDPQKPGALPASEQATQQWSPEHDRAESEARGADPKALAAASGPERAAAGTTAEVVEGPEKPELHVAAAFVGAFLFARILKKIAE